MATDLVGIDLRVLACRLAHPMHSIQDDLEDRNSPALYTCKWCRLGNAVLATLGEPYHYQGMNLTVKGHVSKTTEKLRDIYLEQHSTQY